MDNMEGNYKETQTFIGEIMRLLKPERDYNPPGYEVSMLVYPIVGF